MKTAATIVGALFGCVVLMLYGLFLERPFLTYENLPFPPQYKQVRPGEVIPLMVRRCSSSRQTQVYSVTHSLESADTNTLSVILPPNEHVSIPPGCTTSLSLINRIPKEVPPGHYRIAGRARVDSLFGERWIPWFSEVFEVTP